MSSVVRYPDNVSMAFLVSEGKLVALLASAAAEKSFLVSRAAAFHRIRAWWG